VAAQGLNQVIITLSGALTGLSDKRFLVHGVDREGGATTAGPKRALQASERAAQSSTLSRISESRPLFAVIADFYEHNLPLFTWFHGCDYHRAPR
jgi:hypothetical protein